jgi:hypothetical protein
MNSEKTMTLKALPNLALFRFVKGISCYSASQVWQKQFSSGQGVAKGLVVTYIAQVRKVGRAWIREFVGIGGLNARKKVILVSTRKREVK